MKVPFSRQKKILQLPRIEPQFLSRSPVTIRSAQGRGEVFCPGHSMTECVSRVLLVSSTHSQPKKTVLRVNRRVRRCLSSKHGYPTLGYDERRKLSQWQSPLSRHAYCTRSYPRILTKLFSTDYSATLKSVTGRNGAMCQHFTTQTVTRSAGIQTLVLSKSRQPQIQHAG